MTPATGRRPLVSVLVPTYNGERYLDQTLAHIERQSYQDIEILVRDDVSRDLTAEIVRDHMISDKRISFWANKKTSGLRRTTCCLSTRPPVSTSSGSTRTIC